jgi:hypothetical protein
MKAGVIVTDLRAALADARLAAHATQQPRLPAANKRVILPILKRFA